MSRYTTKSSNPDVAMAAMFAIAGKFEGWEDHSEHPCGPSCPHYKPPVPTWKRLLRRIGLGR